MPARWLDFKAIKAQVPIRDALARLGFLDELREKPGGKLVGSCPIHGGRSGNSFHVDTSRNIWNCFGGCGGGNVLDLVAKAENCEIREAAEKLASWFNLAFDRSESENEGPRKPQERRSSPRPTDSTSGNRAPAPSPPASADTTEEPINPPLPSPLKTLDYDHAYLWSRGLTIASVKTFGVGYCSRGLMKGRVAIPIHNERGELVAYAGRAIDDELAKEGKYKLPAGFEKSRVLWNLHRAREHAGAGLVVVEGFFDAMKVHQAGFPNVVALMGSSLSDHHEELLQSATDRLALMLDGDEAGTKCLRDFYGRLRRRMYLKEIHLEPGAQPDSLSDEEIRALLA